MYDFWYADVMTVCRDYSTRFTPYLYFNLHGFTKFNFTEYFFIKEYALMQNIKRKGNSNHGISMAISGHY